MLGNSALLTKLNTMLKSLLSTGIAIVILAWLLPTVSYLDWVTLLLAAVVLTILNSIVKPILSLLFLPINIVTLGLFSLVLNVALLWLATYLVPGFQILPTTFFGLELNYFFTLVLISFLIGFIQSIIRKVV